MGFGARIGRIVVKCARPCGGREFAVGGVRAVTSNRAQDQARPIGRAGTVSGAQQPRAGAGATGSGGEQRSEAPVPIAKSGRHWSVRVHWGIVFAVVASVVLWLAIKMVISLVL